MYPRINELRGSTLSPAPNSHAAPMTRRSLDIGDNGRNLIDSRRVRQKRACMPQTCAALSVPSPLRQTASVAPSGAALVRFRTRARGWAVTDQPSVEQPFTGLGEQFDRQHQCHARHAVGWPVMGNSPVLPTNSASRALRRGSHPHGYCRASFKNMSLNIGLRCR